MVGIGGPLAQDCGVDCRSRRDTISTSHMLELNRLRAMVIAERYRSSGTHDVCARARLAPCAVDDPTRAMAGRLA